MRLVSPNLLTTKPPKWRVQLVGVEKTSATVLSNWTMDGQTNKIKHVRGHVCDSIRSDEYERRLVDIL